MKLELSPADAKIIEDRARAASSFKNDENSIKILQRAMGGYIIPKRIARKIIRRMFWYKLCRKLGLPFKSYWKAKHPIIINLEEENNA